MSVDDFRSFKGSLRQENGTKPGGSFPVMIFIFEGATAGHRVKKVCEENKPFLT